MDTKSLTKNKNMKYYYLTILAVAIICGCGWLFNHFNPWVGIAAFLISMGVIIKYVNNQIKKHTK